MSTNNDLLKLFTHILSEASEKQQVREFLQDIEQTFGLSRSKTQEQTREEPKAEPKVQQEIKSIADLVGQYFKLLGEIFVHNRKGTRYCLLELTNLMTTDHEKFPVTAVYFDLQNKTKWCRPLIEFDNSFSLVSK